MPAGRTPAFASSSARRPRGPRPPQENPVPLLTAAESQSQTDGRTPRPDSNNMKRRSLAGNCAIGIFVFGLICVGIGFSTASWLVSDSRIVGAKLEKLGLWVHCFRSMPDPLDSYQRRYFVGCRWVYDPFTVGYDKIRGFLMPPFMIATQFFYTLCLIGVIVCGVLVMLFFLCCGPDDDKFPLLIKSLGFICLGSGISGLIGVIIFAIWGNTDKWMPDHANNFFGYSFVLAIVGAAAVVISSSLFLTEANIQRKKRQRLRESQARFEMQQETKA